VQLVPLSQMSVRKNQLLVAAVAAVGASAIAVSPVALNLSPVELNPSSPPLEHRDVQLVNNTEAAWSTVLSDASINLSALHDGATEAGTKLSDALIGLGDVFGGQITDAVKGFGTGIESALTNGWWAKDDGFVFGLFGGTLTSSPTDGSAPVTETGSLLATLSTDLHDGQTLQAFTALDTWSLELLDHTLKPLLAPLLDETSHGITTYSIPVELSQIHTSLLETFTNYNTELKPLSDALLAPFLGVGFGLSSDIQNIGTDLAGADYTQALLDLKDLPSDLVQDFLNGYPAGSEAFPALLADGGLLQELLVTFPTQLASALTEPFTTGAVEAVAGTAPDVAASILGGL
jgi:hypothetical protein